MNPSEYSTTDINLAAFLLTTDHPLKRLDGSSPQRSFVFAAVALEDVTAFYTGAKVDARKLLGTLRDLKGLVVQGARR